VDILTIEQLGELLSMNKRQIYALTSARTRARMQTPLPLIRINGNVRFRKSDVELWLEQLSKETQ
jgi:predicted DNA-binding transcriptional regulator AlpA